MKRIEENLDELSTTMYTKLEPSEYKKLVKRKRAFAVLINPGNYKKVLLKHICFVL